MTMYSGQNRVFLKGTKPDFMRKLKGLFFLLLVSAAAMAQTETGAEPLQFRELTYDFGKVPQGKPVYHYFELVNTTSKPIKLDNVHASCGCTTPEWSKEEIAPGATAKIKVGFNAAAEGAFDKTIMVQYNGSQTRQLRIKGDVWAAPPGSAPANASIQFLKQKITIKP